MCILLRLSNLHCVMYLASKHLFIPTLIGTSNSYVCHLARCTFLFLCVVFVVIVAVLLDVIASLASLSARSLFSIPLCALILFIVNFILLLDIIRCMLLSMWMFFNFLIAVCWLIRVVFMPSIAAWLSV